MSNLLDQSVKGLGDLDGLRKITVWMKGIPIPGWPDSEWRHDVSGSVMKYSEYGNRNSEYGWEFDHYPVPSGLGGLDAISNLRPLNWKNNASHGGMLGNALSNAGLR
jgi:hypothetical protein